LIFRSARAAFAPALPPYLIFFVTHRCNAACPFCFDRTYLTQDQGPELSREEIERIARHWPGLVHVTLTGGEPFLRHDLADIAAAWVRAGAASMTIATNGSLPEPIHNTIQTILARFPRLPLDLNISIDGPATLHDRLRGLPGAHQRAMETAARLAPLQHTYPRFRLGATLTLTAFNQDLAEETIATILADPRFRRVQVLWVRGRPFDPAALGADFGTYERCVELLRGQGGAGWLRVKAALAELARETVGRTVREKRLVWPCLAGRTLVEMDAFGRVYPCEMLWQTRPEGDPERGIASWVMGSLRENDYRLELVLGSDQARRVRAWVRDTSCFCSFECAAYNNIVFNPRAWPLVLRRTVPGAGPR
jgi:MoaA/NifB/PqqE/SkfB family radical SAM enzyme